MKVRQMMVGGLLLACALVFGACSSGKDGTAPAATTPAATADKMSEAQTTEAAGVPNITQPTKGADNTAAPAAEKKAILVVSFGTSYDNREKSIGGIERAISSIDGYEVRRAFTSQIIIDKLKKRDNLSIDNVTEALERAIADGITTLVVQPTHLMDGYEYTDLKEELDKYKGKFDKVAIGAPLLTSDQDFEAVAKALVAKMRQYDDEQTAICFMGHGTEADSNAVYARMQEVLTSLGEKNYFVGTVEATPSREDVMKAVAGNGAYHRVVLRPLMVVAGDHATNDMAGDEEDSWKSQFKAANYEVECVLEGLGEMEDIQQIYVQHVKDAIASLG